ncbi:DNA polymerase Y family protein [Streptomyces chattanoogensis]|uniref:DNA polymerase Y family protein n=1 Tax=Streptomyces chattanoogensis TaxID=66876 RepID=UPI0036C6FD67
MNRSGQGWTEANVLHVRCRPDTAEETYRDVLTLLTEISPAVQALPPTAALVDVRGARCYFGGRTSYQLAETIRLRCLARLGIDTHIGISDTYATSAVASARPTADGLCLVLPDQVKSFLAPLPVGALHGIGPTQARTLTGYGLHTIGALAATPPVTVMRILGGRAGRLLHERSHGIDPRPVTPARVSATTSERITFRHDTLDPSVLRAALLQLVVTLGARLRAQDKAATTISVIITLADRSSVTRSRRMPEASGHTEDLRVPAYRILDALALQRARIRQIAVRAELTEAGRTSRQMTFDVRRESALRLEPVLDRLNTRWGAGTVGPASAFRYAS